MILEHLFNTCIYQQPPLFLFIEPLAFARGSAPVKSTSSRIRVFPFLILLKSMQRLSFESVTDTQSYFRMYNFKYGFILSLLYSSFVLSSSVLQSMTLRPVSWSPQITASANQLGYETRSRRPQPAYLAALNT